MKKTRVFLSFFLCAVLLAGAVCPAFAADTGARLYNVYGDHMLFRQNTDAVFAGEAAPGTAVAATLTDAAGRNVRSAEGTAAPDGTFSLSFTAPAGGYDAYTVTLTANGSVFRVLSDVVFGELWLSFGQSNMEYNLHGTPEGRAMQAQGVTGSRALRVLQVPHPVKDGAYCSDKLPQNDAQNCFWYTGDRQDVYNMSAAAYFFAEKMIDALDMPVGILNAAVGGSGIGAWIPREAIEGDNAMLQAFKDHDAYISLSEWDSGENQFHIDMTGLYNSKIAPLVNFRPAGGVWYQGETDLMLYNDPAYYVQLLTLMQKSYAGLFACENGSFPLVFNQLVTFDYGMGPYAETAFNDAFTVFAAADPASRGEVTICDLSPDYYEEWGAIHPMTKKPIGERMAGCALGLVYGGDTPASAPAKTGVEISDGSVLVTFSNVGDGLMCTGGTLRGFSVYGADGVCVPAAAEIVSADTVRVYSDAVAAPVGAAYAVNSLSPQADLWSGFGGKAYLPAASFGASDPAITKLYDNAAWLTCETLAAWQNGKNSAGVKNVWTAKNAVLSVSADAFEGDGALGVAASKRSFSVTAPFAEKDGGKLKIHDSMDTDYTRYGTLTLRLKNTGGSDVTLNQLRLYKNAALYYTPRCLETGKNSAVIPADGAWHAYTFDLNDLGLYGSAPDRWSNDALDGVTQVRLCFSGADAQLLADDFRFAPEKTGSQSGALLQRLITRILELFQKIRDLFSGLFSK